MRGGNKMMPFQIEEKDIKQLNEYELTTVMKRLLLAEISKLNLSQSAVTASLDVNDPDGGLDGYIGTDVPPGNSWLPHGKSGWQFKAKRDFSKANAIQEVLDKDKKELKPRIRKLLAEKGTYVLVIGAKDYNLQQIKQREEAIKDVFTQHAFPNAVVKVFGSGDLESWVNLNPSVAALIKPERLSFKGIEGWSQLQSIKEPKEFSPDSKRKEHIEQIRSGIISNHNGHKSMIFRVVGLSGIGKTRLVYEALNQDALKHLVCYFDSPDKLPTSRFNSVQNDQNIRSIFVVDECPHKIHSELAKEAEGIGDRFTLITLDYDIDPPCYGDFYIKLEKLEEAALDALIKATTPALPEDARRRIVKWAEGYPKMAIMLAENFGHHPDLLSPDTLNKIGAEGLFNLMIAGRHNKDAPVVQQTKKTLRAIALFKRLGWEDDLAIQGQTVCKLLNIGDWMDVRELVKKQVKRGLIVERGRYRYVTPLPLAIHLAAGWWTLVTKDEWTNFVNSLPDRESRQSFIERLKDLPYLQEGKKAIELLLSDKSFFESREVLDSDLDSQTFLYLAQADHNSAMDTLNRLLDSCSREELLAFKEGRRNVIWALEKIAWWPDTFYRVARLLLKLADAENETWSNNATGVFAGLFQTLLGGTAVPAIQRHIILKEALESSNVKHQKLALQGLRCAVELGSVVRTRGAEDQGVITPPPEWYPKDWNELRQTILSALNLLDQAMEKENPDIRNEAIHIFLSSVRQLMTNGFQNEVFLRLEQIRLRFPEASKEVIERVENTLYYDKGRMDTGTAKKLVEFREKLIGSDFKALLKRYVGMHLLGDGLEERSTSEKSIQEVLKDLANESMRYPQKLETELYWLLTPEAENGYALGVVLGSIDTEYYWLNRLIERLKYVENPSCMLIGGYLSSVKARDLEKWEQTLDEIRRDKLSQKFLLELTWRSGTSDRAIRRIIDMLKKEELSPSKIRVLQYGAWCRGLTEEAFKEFLDEFYKIDQGKSSPVLLGVIHQYVQEKKEFIVKEMDMLLKYLTNPAILSDKDTMTLFHWDAVSDSYLQHYPEDVPKILDFVLQGLSARMHLAGDYFAKKIRYFLENDLKNTWDRISQALLKHDRLAWNLKKIIKGNYGSLHFERNSLLNLIADDLLLDWCDQYPEDAPYILAEMIPLHEQVDLHPIAKKLLIKYPNDKRLMSELSANWDTEGWSGPSSVYLERKLQIAKKWAENTNHSVSEWAKREIEDLERRIETAQREEEERGY
jgi:hypothetical protein